MKTSWQVATAAEAIVAAQFARLGWDVSVQYGANQPEYDLVVVDGGRILKVSVKGSRDGSWGLTQNHLKNADYHAAADKWVEKHNPMTIICLVQFKNISIQEMPKMYLATPQEIGNWLKKAAGGRGDTIIFEHHVWSSKARSAGKIDQIPQQWIFSKERIEELMRQA